CATCTLREDVMARTSRRCGGIEGSTYGQNSDANREYDHDKARDYDIAHINRLLILPMDLARLVACKMRKNQEDQCHEQRKDVGIEIAPTQNIIQHELVYRRLQCGEEYGAQNKPPSRYLFTVGRSLQPSEDDAVIFFSSQQLFLGAIRSMGARTMGRARGIQFFVAFAQQILVGRASVCPRALEMS